MISPGKPPYVVNVGLPRTGNASLCQAARMLSFKALHIWHDAERDPSVLRGVRDDHPQAREFVCSHDVLSDSPFYALRKTFERHYPDTALLFTTRPRDDWIRSMLRRNMSGGAFLADLYDLPPPPYHRSRVADLEAIYDRHHERVCDGLPSIHLSGHSSREKWSVLTRYLPDGPRLLDEWEDRPWPHLNRS